MVPAIFIFVPIAIGAVFVTVMYFACISFSDYFCYNNDDDDNYDFDEIK